MVTIWYCCNIIRGFTPIPHSSIYYEKCSSFSRTYITSNKQNLNIIDQKPISTPPLPTRKSSAPYVDNSKSKYTPVNSGSSSGNSYRESSPSNKPYAGIEKAIQVKNIGKFTAAMKDLAFKNRLNMDHSEGLYEMNNDFLASILQLQPRSVVDSSMVSIEDEEEGGIDSSVLLTPTLLSEWIWSLSKLGFKLKNRQHNALIMELLHLFCSYPTLSSRQVTTTLGGLSKLKCKWKHISVKLKEDIVHALNSVVLQLNDREVGNLLHSLSKLEVPWGELPNSVQNGFLESFVRNSKLLVSEQGSMAVYALGKHS